VPALLVRTALDSSFTPGQALLALRDDVRPFALVGDWAGGGAMVGSAPVRTLVAGEDPLAVIDDVPVVGGSAGVGGGWVGWLGYPASARVERTVPQPPRPAALPEASWAFYDHLLRLDADGRWWFEALWTAERADALAARRDQLAARLATATPPRPRAFATAPFAAAPTAAGHAEAVRRAREYIAAGDLYQTNLTLRLEAGFDDGEAVDLFATGVPALRPARGAYVGDAGVQVCSFSPELFLERHGRAVRSAPIKGTVERTGAPAQLARLRASAKDAAEHVMIVDLMRNDLGRVSAYGSVRAPLTPRAEEHPGVWHLVSDVTAELRDGVTDGELLRATFPPGSVTGAPKVKALEVIATLEATGREVYTGAIGFVSPVAGLELNVAIRTFEVAGGRVWLGVGGGIVADSDPDAELAEALVKAAPLLRAIGGELRSEERPPATRIPPPVREPRPDPAAGLLETLLAVDGRLVEEGAHLARLDRSLRAVFGRPLRAEEVARVRAAARERAKALEAQAADAEAPHAEAPEAQAADAEAPQAEAPEAQAADAEAPHAEAPEAQAAAAAAPEAEAPDGEGPVLLRVRVVATAEGLDVTAAPARTLPSEPVTLVPLVLPGGAGRHKWAERALLDREPPGSGREALLLDLDGSVLEAGRGSIVIAEGDRLVTPPADGRILEGTVRALAGAREEPISLDRLRDADEILVTSAIRGVQAAHLEDTPAPPAPGPQAQRLAARLAEAWGLPVPAAL
jgi:para-aminobenzoate synthetase/4-amino-4-deoxychorismate lyase